MLIDVVGKRGPRAALAAFGWDVVPPWRGRLWVTALLYVIGLRLYPGARDTTDFLATLVAESTFDLAQLPAVGAPTLIVNGGRDRFYESSVVAETARLIAGSQLVVIPDKGHVGVVSDHRAIGATLAFLAS
jgi:pimeloyl-ACP methyl ester carboxylesterase